MIRLLLIIVLLIGLYPNAAAQKSNIPANMVFVKGGNFVPLYGSANNEEIAVADVLIDKYPVTNAEFEAFVAANPKWRKSQVKKLFADAGYLKYWSGDLGVGANADKISGSPVTNVSWFAAKAYCECQGKRLPTVSEWEYAARASETAVDASADPGFYQRSLDWYSEPNPKFLPNVREGFRNYYGIHGMIGMVWEWTSDFNSALIIGESRANGSLDRQLFCGAGSAGASDVKNYVAFMRYAFRSSLKANYTVANLGFRCAKSYPDTKLTQKNTGK